MNPYEAPQTPLEPASRTTWPWWVKLGLWKIPDRNRAVMFGVVTFVLSMMSVGGVILGAVVGNTWLIRLAFVGSAITLACIWYWTAIWWVDTHSRWEESDA